MLFVGLLMNAYKTQTWKGYIRKTALHLVHSKYICGQLKTSSWPTTWPFPPACDVSCEGLPGCLTASYFQVGLVSLRIAPSYFSANYVTFSYEYRGRGCSFQVSVS